MTAPRTTVVLPERRLLVPAGEEWIDADPRFLPRPDDTGSGIYLVTLPEPWMYRVSGGGCRMTARIGTGETFVFDGLGWQREREATA